MSPKMSKDMKEEIAKSSEKMQEKLSMENINEKIEKSRKGKLGYQKNFDFNGGAPKCI